MHKIKKTLAIAKIDVIDVIKKTVRFCKFTVNLRNECLLPIFLRRISRKRNCSCQLHVISASLFVCDDFFSEEFAALCL